VHPITSVAFDRIIDTCPRDLVAAGLLRCVAIQLRPKPYEAVSIGIMAKALNGKAFPMRWGSKSTRRRRLCSVFNPSRFRVIVTATKVAESRLARQTGVRSLFKAKQPNFSTC